MTMTTTTTTPTNRPSEACDVAIIGAGPAGAVAAARLARLGYSVEVLERQVFPRFSIGESLLPQCMEFLDNSGMLPAVVAGGFQLKNGAVFQRNGKRFAFDFANKFTADWSTAYQVQRGRFDKILADQAAEAGASIYYDQTVLAFAIDGERSMLDYAGPDGERRRLAARFCLDGSGFGRVLPRLLGLDIPSQFPVRQSIFTHVVDRIADTTFDREKILIQVHPDDRGVWLWLIPFADGTSSLGVVGETARFADYEGDEAAVLRAVVAEVSELSDILAGAEYRAPVRRITGYAANVSALCGPGFALLGNAGDFLDPVFSSGVTIALKSADLATGVLDRQLRGEDVDWEKEFALPLSRGVTAFGHFVSAWYDGTLQDIIFSEVVEEQRLQMICAILAGYAWDETNPYVVDAKRKLATLAQVCRRL